MYFPWTLKVQRSIGWIDDRAFREFFALSSTVFWSPVRACLGNDLPQSQYTCLPDSFSDQGRDKSEIGYPCQTGSGVK